ncbi:YqaA family protein [Gilvimarinus polysaccharolyticus]|uniref:YqaA family protein n=1 Tax=Gilvimarinus polysaccharolyticus TaxID=863921 RepID=UPI0006732492|nr:VTT domain-containing protein [Gilvimarinus polysaccharolyticus]
MLLLFAVAFIAATIWPMASEAYVSYYVVNQPDLFVMVWLTATLGNTLGAITMFELARFSSASISQKKAQQHQRWQRSQYYFKRYGSAILFFAWLPIIGDLLPLVAGAFSINRPAAYVWLTLGKACRYGFIIWGTLSVLQALQTTP